MHTHLSFSALISFCVLLSPFICSTEKPDTSCAETPTILQDSADGPVEGEASESNEALIANTDNKILGTDNADKIQTRQQTRRSTTVSTGSESNLGGLSPQLAVAASAPNNTENGGRHDTIDPTKQEAGRRGSEFLLIAAQAAEAAEIAEKSQSRATAIRQAAMQLTSDSSPQIQQHSQMTYDAVQMNNHSTSTNGKMLEPDQQLRAQVYSAAAMMQTNGNDNHHYMPPPNLPMMSNTMPVPVRRSTNQSKAYSPEKPRPTPVKHVYHDYGSAPTPTDMPRKKTGGVSQPFPEKLMRMLDRETANNPDVITWCPHGRAFIVRKPKVFTAEVMINYFKQSKLTSFQRQLNLYGFRRITQGVDAGAYYHELFLRGRPDLTTKMARQKVKGTGHKQPTDASTEPNFYSMKPVQQIRGAVDSMVQQGDVGQYPPAGGLTSSQPPPMAVPDGTLYTDGNPMPSPSLQAVAALRRLSNPATNAPGNFSLGAPAVPTQPSDQKNDSWNGVQPDPFPYSMQPVEPSLSPSKVHGFQPTSTLGSCPVASEAAMTMTQMLSSPAPANGDENGADSTAYTAV
jgi:hypothetical protein